MIDRRGIILASVALASGALAGVGRSHRAEAASGSGSFQLIMAVQRGCIYCAAWRREVGPGYAQSDPGRRAPLVEVAIDGPWPDGLVLARRPHLTPTFVLVRGGIELERIEGYPGADAFYRTLSDMLKSAGAGLR
ncbi:SoxS protein [Paracoccus sp. (in: a-proteobacteria)]|uniref:SoxS protein n=1 Tax=Paracoccus sp. TaxID=267 RepID=UPI0028977023|nr:SoxS protein [Paracoccus sp. (in: a-proteobacteria)]